MNPFSHYLHDLRVRHGIRQSELADLLGYEQSYISALETGVKGPPTTEFIEKLIAVFTMGKAEQDEIRRVADASQRKLVLGSDCSQEVYWMFKELREQIQELHPAQIKMIRDALGLKGSFAVAEPELVRQVKRRRREEVNM